VRVQQKIGVDASAPHEARALVDSLRGELGPETIELLRLVLSELATNCVQHGRADTSISVIVEQTTTDQIHVEVGCASGISQPHIVRAGYRGGAGGFGLRLVDKISTDWGVRHQNGRTIVWADVPASPRE